jgi:hypothetical protein
MMAKFCDFRLGKILSVKGDLVTSNHTDGGQRYYLEDSTDDQLIGIYDYFFHYFIRLETHLLHIEEVELVDLV